MNIEKRVNFLGFLKDFEKYYKDFYKMATEDRLQILIPPPGMIRGWVEPEDDVIHPYLNRWWKKTYKLLMKILC